MPFLEKSKFMSLDVSLIVEQPILMPVRQAILVRRDGATIEISREEWNELYPNIEPITSSISSYCGIGEVYTANITHNLGRMAEAAEIYYHLWRPEEIAIHKAEQLIDPLSKGLLLLKGDIPFFERYNSPNGWGMYQDFVPFVARYLYACQTYPHAKIIVSR